MEPEDTIITLMSDLAACLCSELAAISGDGEPPTCFCTPIMGAFPGQAYLGTAGDIAWLRVVDTFGSNTPGEQTGLTFDQTSGETVIVEMGVMRCFSPPKSWGGDDLHELWVRQMQDWGAMKRAIACCTGRSWDDNQLVVGNYVPMGPEGDIFGGMIPLAIQIEV